MPTGDHKMFESLLEGWFRHFSDSFVCRRMLYDRSTHGMSVQCSFHVDIYVCKVLILKIPPHQRMEGFVVVMRASEFANLFIPRWL